MLLSRLVLVVWCAICASVATAHEFWIEPSAYQVRTDEKMSAHLKNGQGFEGINLAFFDRNIARFDVIVGDKVTPVVGRMGDSPALDIKAQVDGLAVIVHETTPSFVTYKSWDKFAAFAEHKYFPDIKARHDALGFGPAPFKERYTRHAKTLIAVGTGAGSDRAIGLETEFVALTNPYAPTFMGTMKVQLLDRGLPRIDAQVEVFDRATDGTVTINLYRTNEKGIAEVPVTPGHSYLFDGVVLRPITDGQDAIWDTFWASLTFAVPQR
jgi:hypothetical protein